MSTFNHVLHNIQTNTPPVSSSAEAAIEKANVTVDVLRDFAHRHRKTLSWAVERFLKINPDMLDEDKSIVLQREQAKIGLEVMKAASTKEINHAGDLNLQVTSIERRIIDAK